MDIDGLNQVLQEISGDDAWPALLVRDATARTGWREWTDEDGAALLERVAAESGDRADLRCFSQHQVAEFLGLSVPKVQELVRREGHPIPHITVGRRLVFPGLLLEEWLREEASLGK